MSLYQGDEKREWFCILNVDEYRDVSLPALSAQSVYIPAATNRRRTHRQPTKHDGSVSVGCSSTVEALEAAASCDTAEQSGPEIFLSHGTFQFGGSVWRKDDMLV